MAESEGCWRSEPLPGWNQGAAKPLTPDKSNTCPVGADVTRILAASHQRLLNITNLPETAPNDPTGPRFLVEDIYPSVDGGRYPVKRIAGEPIEVWADILREGHDRLAAELLWRKETEAEWRREPMRLHSNDRWHGRFTPPEPGRYLFAIEAWTDQFATWRHGLLLKREAGIDVALEAREGRELLGELQAARSATPGD